ncbi:MAG: 3-isopropylmalate dehydrogenase [Gammaproteobacteria bacterium]|nr:3-isopropylmalate dehydrogenase [Gammaproteobacteria bacterium]NNJ83753.1 3-isopropylmalate dehydrogenase [Gammaproteobacteria bacterium]
MQYDNSNRYNRAFPGWSHNNDGRLSEAAIIGILEGEGIGPELMAVCRLILEKAGACIGQRFIFHTGGAIGTPAWRGTGHWVTQEVEDFCRSIHYQGGAVLCGPGGGRFVYELRRRLDLFCKLVPLRPLATLNDIGPICPEARDGVDILVVRENLGGLYHGEHSDDSDEGYHRVRHCFHYTQPQVEAILRVGARLAQLRRGRLCVVYKPGGIPAISGLWQSQAHAICDDMGLTVELLDIDNACYQIIADATRFDVVVASNMFGDVLADSASVLLGSRGMSFSVNFSEDGFGVYQTGHGSAQDIAGKDLANPIGQIQSMILMLREHFDLESLAFGIERAMEDVLAARWRTRDICGPDCREVGTGRMGELIAEAACQRLME